MITGNRAIGSSTLGGARSVPGRRLIPAFGRDRAHAVYLARVSLLNSGPVLYLSDRNVTVQGQRYEDYLNGLTGLAGELQRADSSGLNADVALEFHNSPWRFYDYLIEAGEEYPFEGAGVVIKAAWLDDDGTLLLMETVFKGALDEPREIDLMRFRCPVSSLEFRADLGY